MSGKLTYLITDVPDREELVAELWLDDEMWGEISQEDGNILLELYPRRDGEPWRFPPEAAERLIRRARVDLLQLAPAETHAEASDATEQAR